MIAMLAPLLLANAAPGMIIPTSDPVLRACMAKAVTDPELAACTGAAVDRADAILNARWRVLIAMLKDYSAEDRASVVAGERAWLAYRDKACEVFWHRENFGTHGSSISGPLCELRITKERIADINAMIDDLHLPG